MRLNKILLTLLLVLIPSTGWGMECKTITSKKFYGEVRKCIDGEFTCYIYDRYRAGGISCIKNQEVNND